jgi:hypothetical protein
MRPRGVSKKCRRLIIHPVEPSVVASRCGNYRSLFDRRSGLLARYLDAPMPPGPELLEVRLVGPGGEFIDMTGLRRLLERAPMCRQVLLVGESEQHPALPTILRTIRSHGVVPTLVTSGAQRSSEVLDALARFAGSVAIDCGFSRTQLNIARRFRDAGVRVALHLPVADASVDWLSNSLERGTFEHLVQAVTLTGRSTSGPDAKATGLKMGPGLERLIEVVSRPHSYRINSDARITPFLSGGDIGHFTTKPRCEAGRTGVFVDYDFSVRPCSLLPNHVVGNLEDESLEKIWTGRLMSKFREKLRRGAPPCASLAYPEGKQADDDEHELEGIELRFGFASSSLCDRALLPLGRSQMLHILTAVQDWKALRFFVGSEEALPTQVAASWSSLEFFLSLPPLWGQDLARLHEQLVAGTFEGQEESCTRSG